MTQRHKALLLIGLASFFAASNGAAIKLAVEDIPPLGFGAARVLVSILFLAPWFFRPNFFKVKEKRKLWLYSLLLTVNITLFVLGIGKTTVTMAVAIYAAGPFLVAIFSRFLYQEKLTPRKMVGVVLGLLGTSLVVFTPAIREGTLQSGSLTGNLLMVTAITFFSLYTTLSKAMQRYHQPLVLTQGFLVTSAVVLLPLALWEMSNQGLWVTSMSLKGIAAIIYCAAAGTVGLYLVYQQAVKIATPFIASLFLYLQPLLGVILGVFIFKDKLYPEFIVGASITMASIGLVASRKTKPTVAIEE